MDSADNSNIVDSKNIANCWAKITDARGADFFVDTFYRLLFKHYPETRSLFPEDLKTQKTSLLSMIHSVVNGIEYVNELNNELSELGKRHKNVGITSEMYDYFVIALVTAANLSSNYSFTDDELIAWERAFRKVSETMLNSY